ncbi:hypothetical protein HNR46_000593 [Haloferula luteola]|uniref:Uncharacterized protein n=1 Tax=Haloferula luteola TaxID=595692 RepID=A0A840V9A6_9BACT|nr:hypothetical protein [Haloferula luteola]MBB5350369.1 hypothetical protein [Haloferula luteola]
MTRSSDLHDYRSAYAAAQSAALRAGGPVSRAASPEVEAKLGRMLWVVGGLFLSALLSLLSVGIWLSV